MLVAIPYAIYLSLRTGSRGALIAMIVTYVFMVIRAQGIQRIAIGLLVPIISAAVFATIPGVLIERFSTLFEDNNAQELEATASAEGRKALLMASINYTIRPPLGVGPGQLPTSFGSDNNKVGVTGAWMQPHNSYTQVLERERCSGLDICPACAIHVLPGRGNGFARGPGQGTCVT